MVTSKRHLFVYQANNLIEGFAIRKKNWFLLEKDHEYFTQSLKIQFIFNYNKHIRTPLTRKKNIDIHQLDVRRDYEQVLVLKDYEDENAIINTHKLDALKKVSLKTGFNEYAEFRHQMEVINDKIEEYYEAVERMLGT